MFSFLQPKAKKMRFMIRLFEHRQYSTSLEKRITHYHDSCILITCPCIDAGSTWLVFRKQRLRRCSFMLLLTCDRIISVACRFWVFLSRFIQDGEFHVAKITLGRSLFTVNMDELESTTEMHFQLLLCLCLWLWLWLFLFLFYSLSIRTPFGFWCESSNLQMKRWRRVSEIWNAWFGCFGPLNFFFLFLFFLFFFVSSANSTYSTVKWRAVCGSTKHREISWRGFDGF